jgi:phenylalanyl-tRNA synthetase alpha chain
VTDAPDLHSLDIEALVEQARAAVAGAGTTEEIRQVSTTLSGKKSALAQASRQLGSLEPDARKVLGRRLHEARKAIEELI